MAASDKNIIITPNRSGPTAQPEIFFGGSGNNPIRLKVLDDSTGTLSFEGSAGQLFSINNSLTSGSIFSVNDVSGIPSINVDANGIISMAAFGGTVGIGTTTPTSKLSVAGTISATNIVNGIVVGGSTLTGSVSLTAGSNITLTPSGSTITIASSAGGGGGGVTTTAANTWTATQTFSGGINVSAGATFTSSVESNTGYRVGAGAINAQTTGYSLVAGDNGKIVTINSATACTLTAGTAVGTTGFSCTLIQLGAGQVTVAASGTTINSIAGLKFQGQHAAASLICYATNTFNLAGGLTG